MPLVERASVTEAALLCAVIANPADDLSRLAYADLLEERDGPGDAERAELIRVQLELARRCSGCSFQVPNAPCVPACTDCYRVAWQQQTLLITHAEAISYPVVSILGSDVMSCVTEKGQGWLSGNIAESIRWRVQRGFVSEVRLPCRDWLKCGPALVRVAPLERVRLTDKEPYHNFFADGRELWSWMDEDYQRGTDCLPPVLYNQLDSGKRVAFLTNWYDHSSEGEAVAALSRACLKWAREQQ